LLTGYEVSYDPGFEEGGSRMKKRKRFAFTVATIAIFSFLIYPCCFAGEGDQQTIEVFNPSGVRSDGVFVDKLLKKSMGESKKSKPPLAGDFPDGKTEKIRFGVDAFAAVNELFYKRGWTDGLPIVPPTPERVKKMLQGTDLDQGFVVATLEPMNGQATVGKIAANAVMAGCRPEYMPVIIAAVEAIAEPAFDLRGMTTTTSPDAPMIIITGPAANKLQINHGSNALGRGWQANATIGRALNLIINNVGGSWPGVNDMSTLGTPAEFSMVIAESPDNNPWPGLNIDLGFPKRANVVTVLGVEGMRGIIGIGHTPEQYMKLVSEHMAGLSAQRPYWPVVVLIIARDTAAELFRAGWTKETIREAILKNGSKPLEELESRFFKKRGQGIFRIPEGLLDTIDPKAMIPQPLIGQFIILYAGGSGEKSMLIPGWFGAEKAVSKEVRLPANWEDLLKEENK
jgi:hypothetical protein